MNKFSTISAGAALFALAACGGTTVDEAIEDIADEFQISSGVLDDIELPKDEDLADLPSLVSDLVNEFEEFNEDYDVTSTLPSGSADYTGTLGFQVEDQETYLAGDLALVANFDALTFDGTYSNIAGVSEDGDTLTVIGSVPVDTTIRDGSDGVTFDGTLFGDVSLEDETYRFNALIDGAFGGTNGEVAVAEVSGNIGDPDGGSDEIFGLVTLAQD